MRSRAWAMTSASPALRSSSRAWTYGINRIIASASGPATMHGRNTYASVLEPSITFASASSSFAFCRE